MTRPRRRSVWALAVIVVTLTSAASFGWWVLVARQARAARRALVAGRYEDAEAAVERWLRLSPAASEPLLLRVRAAVARNRIEQAVEMYRKIKASRSPGSEAELVGAILGAKVGRIDQAEPILSRAFLEARGPDPQLDEALAKIYLEKYDFARASTVLDRWKVEAPNDPKPYLWRAEIDSRRPNGTGDLIADYREALRRDPNLAKARLGLADQFRLAHRSAEASAEYDAYLTLAPDDPAGHFGASLNLLELGDEASATRHLDRAIALDPGNAQAHKERAEVDLRHGDAASALSHLDRAVAIDPYDVPIRYSRGMVLTRLGKTEAARAEHVAANRLRADNDRLTTLQARLLVTPHDLDLQLQTAQWMFDHGQPKAGVRWAEKILEETPNHPEASRLLAHYYESQGEPGLARFHRLHAGSKPDAH